MPEETKVQETEHKQEETQPEVKEAKPEEAKAPPLDERTRNAIELYNLLDNPSTAPDVIRVLANRAGVFAKQTGVSAEEAKESTLDVLKKMVPQEHHFLIDSLGPALEKLIDKKMEGATKPLANRIEESDRERVERDVNYQTDKFVKDNNISKETYAKMTELSKKIHMGPESSIPDYLETLHTLATKEQKVTKSVAKTVDRINKNAQEENLSSSQVGDERNVRSGSRLPSIHEAVSAAFRGEKI